MERWIKKVAVVTGASAGIGYAICERLVEEGLLVAGLARRHERVQQLSRQLSGKAGKLLAVKCDITKEEDIKKAFEVIKNELGPVHILVNGAGMYKNGSLLDGNPDDWRRTLETNVVGLTMCSQLAVKQMKDSNIAGHIIHINSIAGHKPIARDPPVLNMYSPSKFAVTCLADIMRQEILHVNADVKVTSISPGLVDTEIFERAGSTFSLKNLTLLKPSDIADAVVYVLQVPPHAQILELMIAPAGKHNLKDN